MEQVSVKMWKDDYERVKNRAEKSGRKLVAEFHQIIETAIAHESEERFNT